MRPWIIRKTSKKMPMSQFLKFIGFFYMLNLSIQCCGTLCNVKSQTWIAFSLQYLHGVSKICKFFSFKHHHSPTTRVHPDNDRITYLGKTFSISAWRNGLIQLANEITQDLATLCLNQENLIIKQDHVE